MGAGSGDGGGRFSEIFFQRGRGCYRGKPRTRTRLGGKLSNPDEHRKGKGREHAFSRFPAGSEQRSDPNHPACQGAAPAAASNPISTWQLEAPAPVSRGGRPPLGPGCHQRSPWTRRPRNFSGPLHLEPEQPTQDSGLPLSLSPLIPKDPRQGPRLPEGPGQADARRKSASVGRTHFRPPGTNGGVAAGAPLAGVRAADRLSDDSGRFALRTR